LCFTLALTFYPLPSVFTAFRRDRAEAKGEGGQERKWQLADFGCADERPVNPVARIFMETANNSPSPWGDLSRLGNGERNLAKPKAARPSERARASPRRDEGGRKLFEISHRKFFIGRRTSGFRLKNRGLESRSASCPKIPSSRPSEKVSE
jgi:hypothetical protein